MVALTYSGTVGAGSILTLIILVATVVAVWFKWRQGDPSEWRDNYMAEVTRREDLERRELEQREAKHQALTELAAARGRTDLAPLMTAIANLQAAQQRSEERMTTRLDAFEKNQAQVATVLGALVDQVSGLREAA